MPLLFLPVCPWSSLVNTSAPGIGGPYIFPTLSLWMISPSYSCRYHLRVRASKSHDSLSKPWMPSGHARRVSQAQAVPGRHQPTPWHMPCSPSEPLDPEDPSLVFSQCGHCHLTRHGYCIRGRTLRIIMVKMDTPCIVTCLAFRCFLIPSIEW